MTHEELKDTALVLLGHGTNQTGEHGQPCFQHAEQLRQRGIFGEVHETYWTQHPKIEEQLPRIRAARVLIVPLFMSEGSLCEVAIPHVLGLRKIGEATFARSEECTGQKIVYCKPIGTHEQMADIILGRAMEVAEAFPFPHRPKPEQTTLLIAGHGTTSNENTRRAVEQHAGRIRRLNLFAAVHAVFLEENPRISDYHQIVQTPNIIMVPFFAGEGAHTTEDIPVLLGEPRHVVVQRRKLGLPPWRNPTEKQGKLIWYSAAVGTHPRVAEVILDRVREVMAKPVL